MMKGLEKGSLKNVKKVVGESRESEEVVALNDQKLTTTRTTCLRSIQIQFKQRSTGNTLCMGMSERVMFMETMI